MQKSLYYSAGGDRSRSMYNLETPTPDYVSYVEASSRYNDGYHGYHVRNPRVMRVRSMKEPSGQELQDFRVDYHTPRQRESLYATPREAPRRATSQYSLPPSAGDRRGRGGRDEFKQAHSQYNLHGREEPSAQVKGAQSCFNVHDRPSDERPVRLTRSSYSVRQQKEEEDDPWWNSGPPPTWAQFRPHPRQHRHFTPPKHQDKFTQFPPVPTHQEKTGKFTPPPPYQDKYSQYQPPSEKFPPYPPGPPLSYDQVIQEYEQYKSHTVENLREPHRGTPDPDYDRTPPHSLRNNKLGLPPVITSEKQIQNGSVYKSDSQFQNGSVEKNGGFKVTNYKNTF